MEQEMVQVRSRRSSEDDDSKPTFEAKGHFRWETAHYLARTALLPAWAWQALPLAAATFAIVGAVLFLGDSLLAYPAWALGGGLGVGWAWCARVARKRARGRLMGSAGEHHLLFFKRGMVCGCPRGRNQVSWRNIIAIRQVGRFVVMDTTPFRHDIMAWELDPESSFRRADKTPMTFDEAVAEARRLWQQALRDPWHDDEAPEQAESLYS